MGMLYYPIVVSPDLKETYFIIIIFKVYFSIIGFDESDKLCWKYGIFLFQQWKKGRYILHSMSYSLYKSVYNTEIYVRIVASWLLLMYILWVFYVIICLFVTSSLTPVYLEG